MTAQKRAERLEDVPLSIAAVSGDSLVSAGVTDVASLTQVVSGLRIERTGAFTQPSIRGITTLITLPGADANVAIYVDGVYQPSQIANAFELLDIERVEVLKGPQGTLFGRNATGGAIQLFTKAPSLTNSAVDLSVGYGRFDERYVKGVLSTPLVDNKLAISLSGLSQSTDSYNDNLVHGGREPPGFKSELLRGKLLWTPTDYATVTLSGFYLNREDPTSFQLVALNQNTVTRSAPGVIIPDRPYTVSLDPEELGKIDVENYGGSVRADFDFDRFSITSISAYNEIKANYALDPDMTQIDTLYYEIWQPSKTYSQELNFASDTGARFNWIAGLYYYHNEDGHDPLTIKSPTDPMFLLYTLLETDAYAAFTELTYALTDRFVAIAGARYSEEEKTVFGSVGSPDLIQNGAQDWSELTPRVSLRYEINPSTQIYTTYSKGFKSGTFDPTGLNDIAVAPETVSSYEIGVKFAGPALRLNAATFYYDYKDLQIQAYDGLLVTLENAGSSEIYGIDADIEVPLTDTLSMTAGATWQHARYENYPIATVWTPMPQGGNAQSTADATGQHNVRTPEFTANLSLDYGQDFGAGRLSASASAAYASKSYFEAINSLHQDPTVIVNARLSFEFEGTPLRLSLWGRNLTDELFIQSTNIQGTGTGVSYAPPRSYGVEAGVRF